MNKNIPIYFEFLLYFYPILIPYHSFLKGSALNEVDATAVNLSITLFPARPLPTIVRSEVYQDLLNGLVALLMEIAELAEGAGLSSLTPEQFTAHLKPASMRVRANYPAAHTGIVNGYNRWALPLIRAANAGDENARRARNRLLGALQSECIRGSVPLNFLRGLAFPIAPDRERIVQAARSVKSVILFAFDAQLDYHSHDLSPESLWEWLENEIADQEFLLAYRWMAPEVITLYAHATGCRENAEAAIDSRLTRMREEAKAEIATAS